MFIIEQKVFIEKLREVIEMLYSYDYNANYQEMLDNASRNYVEENEIPEQYANLISINIPENIEGKEKVHFSSLEEVLNNIGINDVEKIMDIFDKYIYTNYESYRAYQDGEEVKDFEIFSESRHWKNNYLYTNELRFINWKNFSENVKHKARYFDHKEFSVTKNLNKLNDFFERMKTTDDSIVYRARKIYSDKDKKDIEKNESKELGKAPIHIVKNNRFSPLGISYGYFAFDEITALSEARASNNDEFAIGKFRLTNNLALIDFRKESFSKLVNPFLDTFNINTYYSSLIIKEFIEDISKPIEDEDTLLEYVPTQIMAEYIWSEGYGGFIFDSSQNENGGNIVIFGENPEYESYEIRIIP